MAVDPELIGQKEMLERRLLALLRLSDTDEYKFWSEQYRQVCREIRKQEEADAQRLAEQRRQQRLAQAQAEQDNRATLEERLVAIGRGKAAISQGTA